jgi:hypothetical protein
MQVGCKMHVIRGRCRYTDVVMLPVCLVRTNWPCHIKLANFVAFLIFCVARDQKFWLQLRIPAYRYDAILKRLHIYAWFQSSRQPPQLELVTKSDSFIQTEGSKLIWSIWTAGEEPDDPMVFVTSEIWGLAPSWNTNANRVVVLYSEFIGPKLIDYT